MPQRLRNRSAGRTASALQSRNVGEPLPQRGLQHPRRGDERSKRSEFAVRQIPDPDCWIPDPDCWAPDYRRPGHGRFRDRRASTYRVGSGRHIGAHHGTRLRPHPGTQPGIYLGCYESWLARARLSCRVRRETRRAALLEWRTPLLAATVSALTAAVTACWVSSDAGSASIAVRAAATLFRASVRIGRLRTVFRSATRCAFAAGMIRSFSSRKNPAPCAGWGLDVRVAGIDLPGSLPLYRLHPGNRFQPGAQSGQLINPTSVHGELNGRASVRLLFRRVDAMDIGLLP